MHDVWVCMTSMTIIKHAQRQIMYLMYSACTMVLIPWINAQIDDCC